MDKEFLLEQYKQNWEYIRQCEDVRLRHTQVFFFISAAFLSFFAFLIKGEIPDKTLLEVMASLKILVLSALVFLSIYATMVTAFILFQKVGYENYRETNSEIEAHFKGLAYKKKTVSLLAGFAITSPFTWWFGSIAFITFILWVSLLMVTFCI